jgi:chaperonin GroEL
MAKQIIFSQEAREKLQAGVDKLARAVTTTLGPRGRNVALDSSWGTPNITHDGVTVAKAIDLEDPFENMGAKIAKQAALKTNDSAGDGTTTAILLTQHIVAEGIKNIVAGANPMAIRKGIELASKLVVERLAEVAKEVSSKEETEQIASISAGCPEIGKKISDALEVVGRDGVVTVEDGQGLDLEIEYKEGMVIDKGFITPYFINKPEKMEAEIESPYILVTDASLSSLDNILPIIEALKAKNRRIVIIAENVDGEALQTLLVNHLHGKIKALVVKAPAFGDRKREILNDIATITGATLISKDTGRLLDTLTVEDFGKADKVIADKDETTIVGGGGTKEGIEKRIAQLKVQEEQSSSPFDKEKIQERIAKLSSGVAIIRVGAATEMELKEKSYRVEDAVNATKAALAEGIIPGGGIAMLQARKTLLSETTETDTKIGFDIVYRALEAPIRKLAENAGEEIGRILERLEDSDDNFGYDVITGEIVDLLESGIIDPVKVARSAIQNATSAAIMILTTDSLVTDLPDKEGSTPPIPPRGPLG